MPPEPGRNDPCPCGSGLKYKRCCLKAAEATDFVWRQLRSAEGRLVPELFNLAMEDYGVPFLGAGLDEFFVWNGVPENYEESEEFATFFVPWFVFDFVADPHDPDAPPKAPDEAIAAVYRRRHGDRLSSVELAFLDAACASPWSFYAITKTIPGQQLTLHDVLTGTDVVVRERSASQTASPGGLLFARVITVGDMSIVSGSAPLLIPPSWHNSIIDCRVRLARKRVKLTREDVLNFDLELRELYFYIEDLVYNPPLPEMQNTDGDPIVITTLKFRLRCSPGSAFERLMPLAHDFDSELVLSDASFDETGTLVAVSIPWSKKGNRLHKEWENTVLGRLEIVGDRLEANVNSARRAKKVRREIEKRLGPDVEFEDAVAGSIETLLEEQSGQRIDPLEDAAQERLQQHPEVQAFMQKEAARHWEAWFDEKIPALGNRTPRQAARTEEGRERLEALLADYAWQAGRIQNAFAPDIPMLRRKLDLPSRS
jgi:hypothetical protein